MPRARRLALAPLLLLGCSYPAVEFAPSPPEDAQDVGDATLEAGGDADLDTMLDADATVVPDAPAEVGVDSATDDGVDTGTIDSGTIDSGTVDSGTVDSGTVDSGKVDTGTIDTGVDSGTPDTGSDAAPPCRTTGPSVLFYGPVGSKETAFLPTGSTTTTASETTWRAMSTADFAKYDLIVIGDPDTVSSGPTAAQLLAAFETRASWGPAVTGRVAVLGLDPGYHTSMSKPGADTFLKATLKWLSTGAPKTTALYVTSDWGRRGLDFLSPLGAFGSTTVTGDAVTVTTPSHPVMIGSTSASLSSWTSSFHSFVTFPWGFSSIATGVSSGGITPGSVVVVRDGPTCTP